MKIGVFDSGIGGLTVLKEIINRYPKGNYLYYGDTLHLPYGEKITEQLLEYSQQIIDFFLEQQVDKIVIACGTVSSTIYQELKAKYDIEFINVIEIIAVLSAMLIPVLKQTGSKAYQAECTDCLRRIPDFCIGLDTQGFERLHPVRSSVFPCSYTRLTSDEIGDPGRSIPFFDGILSFNGASGCGASFHGSSPDAAGKADPPYPGSVSNAL